MNSGPYVDHDDQEYQPGPIDPGCRLCDLPLALCACRLPDVVKANADWFVAAFAVVGVAVVLTVKAVAS